MAKTKGIPAKQPQITGPATRRGDPEKPSGEEFLDPSSPPRRTKLALLRDMLGDPNGVRLQTLMLATGWQSHTVRAAISGLRKSGQDVTRTSDEGGTIYTATPASGSPSKAAVASIAGTRLREGTVREAGDPKTSRFPNTSIASEVEDEATPVSEESLIIGANVVPVTKPKVTP